MAIRVVVFDIGGVLEITPRLNIEPKWEAELGLKPGELDQKMMDIWKGGSIGTITEADVYQAMHDLLGMDEAQVEGFTDDIWREYLGTPNTELITYFAGLRPKYRTAIISNSFVGAREREEERYHFGDMTELIIYSHEVGLQKPNPEIFQLACQRLNIQPEEMIFVDDSKVIIEAANKLGIHGILHTDTAQTIAAIEARLAANTA